MLSQLQASFKQLELSLQRLTDSIAAYNPSTSAAEELVAADEAVSGDLDQLVEHQQNHLRVEELLRTTRANDEILKTQLRRIVGLRKEMASMQAYEAQENKADIQVDELLSYAKFISKTTVPPTMRREDMARLPLKPKIDKDASTTNGVTSSPNGIPDETTSHSKNEHNVGIKSMNEEDKAWLDPMANLPFEPWPSVDVIQRGALADIQRMIDRGEDPASVLSPEEQEEADRQNKLAEERERHEQEERERRRMSMFDVAAGARRRPTAQDDVFDPDA